MVVLSQGRRVRVESSLLLDKKLISVALMSINHWQEFRRFPSSLVLANGCV